MYKNLILILMLAFSVNTFGQFGGSIERHFRKKTENKFKREGKKKAQEGVDAGVNAGLNEAEKGANAGINAANDGIQKFDDWAEDEFADEMVFVDENLIDASNIQWQRLRFTTGKDLIFYDKPFNYEKENKAPSNWIIKYRSSTEISEFDQGKMIIAGGEGFLTPKVSKMKEDYLPDNFTFEFDFMMPVSPFSKPMSINFYAKNQQNKKGFWPIKINKNIVTYKDSTEKYPVVYLDDNGMDQWYRFSLSFDKGLIKIYLNERLMVTYQDDINPTGISIDYMAYTPIFFKNFILATNVEPIEDQLKAGEYISYNIDFLAYKELLSGRSISELAPIANLLKDNADMKIEAEVYFSQYEKKKENEKYGKQKAEDIKTALISMGASENQITTKYKGSIESKESGADNYKSEMVVFKKK